MILPPLPPKMPNEYFHTLREAAYASKSPAFRIAAMYVDSFFLDTLPGYFDVVRAHIERMREEAEEKNGRFELLQTDTLKRRSLTTLPPLPPDRPNVYFHLLREEGYASKDPAVREAAGYLDSFWGRLPGYFEVVRWHIERMREDGKNG